MDSNNVLDLINKGSVTVIPLEKYKEGIMAITKLNSLKNYVLVNRFSISRKAIAAILDFQLPDDTGKSDEGDDLVE